MYTLNLSGLFRTQVEQALDWPHNEQALLHLEAIVLQLKMLVALWLSTAKGWSSLASSITVPEWSTKWGGIFHTS